MMFYLFLSLSHFIGRAAGDKISAVRHEVSGREGESVTLRCEYETTSDYVYLYWYKHHSDLQAPHFILRKGGKANQNQNIPPGRYTSSTTPSSTELTISRLTLADSALYYCALETQ
ncbi:T-cell receptor delta chain [Solea senegalensis]|nr:T-cell receptor delta chain [Solea senegalensis]